MAELLENRLVDLWRGGREDTSGPHQYLVWVWRFYVYGAESYSRFRVGL